MSATTGGSLEEVALRVIRRLSQAATPLVSGRWWMLRVGGFASLLSLFLQTPALELPSGFFARIQSQGDHPFLPMNVSAASHEGKLAFRLFPPLLVRLMHLSPGSYYALQVALGIATLTLIAWLLSELGYSRRVSLALTLAFAFTYLGSVWFVDIHPYFDALAATALVMAMAVVNPVLAGLAMSAALWTDERAILPAVAVAVWHLNRRQKSGAVAVVVAVSLYAVLRLYLGHRYGLETGRSEMGLSVLHKYFSTMPIALVLALEGMWPLLAAGLTQGLFERRSLSLMLMASVLGSAVTSVMVDDVTRSTVYLLPAVLTSAAFLIREREPTRTTLVGVCVALCLLVPTTGVVQAGFTVFYPLPLRILF